ncbi:hypothetical protein AB0M58_29630 [Streptomyces bobili]|uniref:hypothetical protein n=1 Tax=Streptomyces bobili TaxID=67280 RepID=UPI0034462176
MVSIASPYTAVASPSGSPVSAASERMARTRVGAAGAEDAQRGHGGGVAVDGGVGGRAAGEGQPGGGPEAGGQLHHPVPGAEVQGVQHPVGQLRTAGTQHPLAQAGQ